MAATIQVTTGEWPVEVVTRGGEYDDQTTVVPTSESRTIYLREGTQATLTERVGDQGNAGEPERREPLPENLREAPHQALSTDQMPISGPPVPGDQGGSDTDDEKAGVEKTEKSA